MAETNANNNTPLSPAELQEIFALCLSKRLAEITEPHTQALRLFNGFYEGLPGLVVDLYGETLVLLNHAKEPESLSGEIAIASAFYRERLPWIKAVLHKERHAEDPASRDGRLLFGSYLNKHIIENEVAYALDLRLNQDCGFYLDTRELRKWLQENMDGKSLLNCFAYTGTLGIAALAGGARSVIQTDLNANALQLARRSASLNHFSGRMPSLTMDYFKVISRFKTSQTLFDCVILDPPLFSATNAGTVSLLDNWLGLINKARPLVAHGGSLVLINNALFLSGQELNTQLQQLAESQYVSLQQIIDVPADVTGYLETIRSTAPAPTAPYNHPTKISILGISRKDLRVAD